ncbi:hypothetical protein O1L60_37170 [Streptomyces diastatochromogenes]|nr:hypothetical protein [Streptomyces diastatochromogenes]
MIAVLAHPDRDTLGTLWFLVSRTGHLDCGRWTFEDDKRLRCACGAVLYVYQQPADAAGSGGAPAPAGTFPRGREERMLPAETAQLVALVAAMCPSMHLEDTTTDAWHLLLADLDVADVRAAVTRLGRQRSRIAASEIRAEVRAIREERLARNPLPLPDSDPDDPRRYRAELLELVTAIASGRRTPGLRTPGRRAERVPAAAPSVHRPSPRPREARPARPLPPRALSLVRGRRRPSLRRPPARNPAEEGPRPPGTAPRGRDRRAGPEAGGGTRDEPDDRPHTRGKPPWSVKPSSPSSAT